MVNKRGKMVIYICYNLIISLMLYMTNFCFISKIERLRKTVEFKSISLCNFVYKIILTVFLLEIEKGFLSTNIGDNKFLLRGN